MIFIGPFPDPVHGQSLATQNLYDFLKRENLNIQTVNVSGSLFRKILMNLYASILIFFSKKTSVYISLNSNKGLILNLLMVFSARVRNFEVFLHYHAYDHIRRKTLTLKLLSRISGGKAQHIVLGKAMEDDLKDCIGYNSKIIILNNSKLIHQKYNKKSNELSLIRLGHLSNLTKEKGLTITINTAIYLSKFLNIELYLAGPATSEEIKNEIIRAKEALGSALIYLGPIYDDRKNNFYDHINFFIFPSQYKNEAEPLVVLEALAAGIPVIASDIGCISGDLSNKGGVVFKTDESFPQSSYKYLEGIQRNKAYNRSSLNAREQFLDLLNQSDNQLRSLLWNIKQGEKK